MIEIAREVKAAGARILRGGAFKPRTNPYSFQGLGEEGLKYLQEAGRITGMPTDSEAVGESSVELVGNYASIIHIGTRNGKSYELLKKAGDFACRNSKAIFLKRGESATIEEFLCAAEYIANEGCTDIILCLRGIRTYENKENGFRRYSGDIDAIPVLKSESHLPVVFDPSHSAGDRKYIRALCKAAIAAGADGLMIETHVNPDKAKSDAPQHITPQTLREIVNDSRRIYNAIRRGDAT
jgi:3-deoxy-7-phosphoheptulonate synthase